MGFFKNEKKQSTVQSTEYFPNGKPTSTFRSSGYSSLADVEKKDLKYKKSIRILRFITRAISLVISGFMVGTLSYTLASYYTTKNRQHQNSPIWGEHPVLWPTYMLISVSGVNLTMNIITLGAYVCGVGAANKAGDFADYVGYVVQGLEVIVWAVSSGIYKFADTGKDLWGYSCSPAADKIAEQVKSFVDFGKLCQTQTGTWFASIIQAVLYTVTFITVILVWRRGAGKKKLAKIRESMSTEQGYVQNLELGTTYSPGTGRRYMPVSGES